MKIGILLLLCIFFAACSSHRAIVENRPYTVLNKGIAGNNTNDLMKRVSADVLNEQPDLVILLVGANDMINSHKFVSYQQFDNNYRALIKSIKDKGIALVLMSPLPVDSGYLFQRHERALFQQDPNSKLDSVTTIVKNIAAEQHLGFIDLNRIFKDRGEPGRGAHSLIVNAANMGKEDGVHPTKEGYQFMTTVIYNYLKKHRLLRKKHKLICFGDSITYGAFMDGAGTTTGDTYPALLKKRLNGK
ncbi:GDSL-type esterase/lipase family protein [Chitinophaga sp. MM2321]|uniref:SGNH/GDSL hydrolase family protein n=1 Tax=Chitinophaga sp. MM2321 TaxID=3137178 RepID=UPI0032D580E3